MDINGDADPRPLDENTLRAAFSRHYQLCQNSLHAQSFAEYARLRQAAENIEKQWEKAPGGWGARWQFLAREVQRCADQPVQAREKLHRLVLGQPAPALNLVEMNSVLQAAKLTSRDRLHEREASSGLVYFAFYFQPDLKEVTFGQLTSWWRARNWLDDQSVQHPDGLVDVEIVALDCVSGVEYRLLSGQDIAEDDLHAELDQLTEILGGEREPDGKPFVDELHYDVLTDLYIDAVTAANHPHVGQYRLEHKLHADDLRDQTLDFATRIGLNATDHLATLDHTALRRAATTATPATSWLDTAVHDAHIERQRLDEHAFSIQYPACTEPRCAVRVGWNPSDPERPWQAEELRQTGSNDHTGELTPIGRYRTPGELVDNLERWSAGRYDDHDGAHLHYAARRLYDWQHRITKHDTQIDSSTGIRDAIRAGAPHKIRTSQLPRSGMHTETATPAEASLPVHETPTSSPASQADHQQASRQRRKRAPRQPGRNRPHGRRT
ncbi:hypothetical protein AB0H76_09795 [Nocardia sp. NPDC050712]|uniref:hypothetical protein n=1 Tax=Nocardia sp. NPDC050712 TaxID=3155518 RepID=UPI0033D0F82D